MEKKNFFGIFDPPGVHLDTHASRGPAHFVGGCGGFELFNKTRERTKNRIFAFTGAGEGVNQLRIRSCDTKDNMLHMLLLLRITDHGIRSSPYVLSVLPRS